MTDLEISKALALAIGWKRLMVTEGKLRLPRNEKQWGWQVFDYRDWNIIGPIAEKFDAFPISTGERPEKWGSYEAGSFAIHIADTPQKAIALAVIQGAKK
jgi:hypothetical protein